MSWLTKWLGGNTDVRVDSDSGALRTHDAEVLAAAAALGYRRVAGSTKVTVDVTSKTLLQLGLTLNASTKGLIFIVPTAGIFWNYGTALATSAPMLTGTNEELGLLATLNTLQFIVASGTVDMWVEEVG